MKESNSFCCDEAILTGENMACAESAMRRDSLHRAREFQESQSRVSSGNIAENLLSYKGREMRDKKGVAMMPKALQNET
jgi:hypothetical protein